MYADKYVQASDPLFLFIVSFLLDKVVLNVLQFS